MDRREQAKGWTRATWWRSVLWSLACLASVSFAVPEVVPSLPLPTVLRPFLSVATRFLTSRVPLGVIVGGVVGGFLGARLAKHLSGTQGRLTTVFAGLIFVVAAYRLWKSAAAL
mgnify:CR=1 FL=1